MLGSTSWIEVHDDDVNGLDPVLSDRVEILRVIAPRQDAPMNGGVQGLHPALQHLGKARNVRHVGHGQAGVGERARGAAGRNQLEPARREAAGDIHDAGLIGNAQEGSWHKA